MASEPIYKVFVSSTFVDLREERAEVQKALLKLNCLPVGMELFPAADEETWNFIKEQINDSDYYVVLVAGRYGSLDADGTSFTEKEYDYAREKGIPSIGFVHADRAKIPSGHTESDPDMVRKLDALVQKIKTRPVRQFSNPHQLALEVTTSFVDLKRTKPRTGFVRTDQAVDYKKYAELLERNTELEKRMHDLEADDQVFRDHDKYVDLPFDTEKRVVEVPVTWGEIFLAVAGLTLDIRAEDFIKARLTNALIAVLGLRGSVKRDLLNDLYASNIIDGDFNNIREQLFALDLIDVDIEMPEPASSILGALPRREWKLTEHGRRQFALLRVRESDLLPDAESA